MAFDGFFWRGWDKFVGRSCPQAPVGMCLLDDVAIARHAATKHQIMKISNLKSSPNLSRLRSRPRTSFGIKPKIQWLNIETLHASLTKLVWAETAYDKA